MLSKIKNIKCLLLDHDIIFLVDFKKRKYSKKCTTCGREWNYK